MFPALVYYKKLRWVLFLFSFFSFLVWKPNKNNKKANASWASRLVTDAYITSTITKHVLTAEISSWKRAGPFPLQMMDCCVCVCGLMQWRIYTDMPATFLCVYTPHSVLCLPSWRFVVEFGYYIDFSLILCIMYVVKPDRISSSCDCFQSQVRWNLLKINL